MTDGTQGNTQDNSETQTPAGVPQIPAGAQLGGAGVDANQVPAQSPLTTPQNPIQEELKQPVHPQVQADKPADPVYKNPYASDATKAAESTSYIETSIQHLTGELGVAPDVFDAVIENALKHNDLSLINTSAIGKDLTPEQSTRVQQLATAAYQEVQANIARAKADVYFVAGGEAQWETAVQAFNANAPEDALGYAAYLADKGNLKGAAEYVINYNKQGGFVTQQTQTQEQGGTGSVQSGLSKAEYTAELGKIEREAGNRSLGSPAYAGRVADLDARRALGRSQGR